MTAPDDPADEFEDHRPKLHAIAYRMTGSVSDADDLCQEAWLRWRGVDRSTVGNVEAYLVSIVSRLAIDRCRSAAHRREVYVGPYLPEPVVGSEPGPVSSRPGTDPADAVALADSLTFAFLVMLDALDPVERVVLVLHDVFAYPFDQIASVIGSSNEAARQTASRARRKVRGGGRGARPPGPEVVQATMGRLLTALAAGDVEGVMAELAPDVVQLDDGGALKRAARRPVVGSDRVARLWINLARRNRHLSLQMAEVNARPGLVFFDGERPEMVLSAEFDASGHITQVFSQLNPDKLSHLGPSRDD